MTARSSKMRLLQLRRAKPLQAEDVAGRGPPLLVKTRTINLQTRHLAPLLIPLEIKLRRHPYSHLKIHQRVSSSKGDLNLNSLFKLFGHLGSSKGSYLICLYNFGLFSGGTKRNKKLFQGVQFFLTASGGTDPPGMPLRL